jgi:hypothetical protein
MGKKVFQLEQDEGTVIVQKTFKTISPHFTKKNIWAALP